MTRKECIWKYAGDNCFSTSCGSTFVQGDVDSFDYEKDELYNDAKYCCFCGKKLTVQEAEK